MPSISGRPDPGGARLAGYDLILDSAVSIPGTVAVEQGAADIRIDALPAAPNPVDPDPVYRFEGDTLVFSAPGVATYRCRRDAITVTPRQRADPQAVTALLIATALPAVLWQRGDFMLHAASVILPGEAGALAIAGPSGIGKSAAVAQLLASGATLVADDSVRLCRASDTFMASGLPAGYHLGAPRSFHLSARSVRRAPLGAILILAQGDRRPGIERLGPVEAVEALLANRHRPRVPELLGFHADVLQFCAYLARAVPVYRWRRQRGVVELDASEWALLARCGRS